MGNLNLSCHLNEIILHDYFLIRKDQYNGILYIQLYKKGILISACAYDHLLAYI